MFTKLIHLLLVVLSCVELVVLPLLLVLDLLVPDVHSHLVTSHLPCDLGAASLSLLITTLTVVTVTVIITLMLLVVVILCIVLRVLLFNARHLGQPVLDFPSPGLGLVLGQPVRQLGSHLVVLLLEVHLLDAGQSWQASPLPSSVSSPLFLLVIISADLAASP